MKNRKAPRSASGILLLNLTGHTIRAWVNGSGSIRQSKSPGFLPDNEEVRNDIADYLAEIQWFDHHLQTMIDHPEGKR